MDGCKKSNTVDGEPQWGHDQARVVYGTGRYRFPGTVCIYFSDFQGRYQHPRAGSMAARAGDCRLYGFTVPPRPRVVSKTVFLFSILFFFFSPRLPTHLSSLCHPLLPRTCRG